MTKKSITASPKPKLRTPRSKRPRIAAAAPSQGALQLLSRANDRVKGRSAGGRNTAVRHAFIDRGQPAGPADDLGGPPLALLLRASKGGALRVKLYLAVLWQAGGGDERHTVSWPARAWAALLDLPEPEGRGDRRIRDAIRALEQAGLLMAAHESGRPATITLLRDDGTAETYTNPGEAARAAKEKGAFDPGDLYVQLPPSFWTKGWALVLSGPGIAMLLVMLVLTKNGEKKGVWISPAQARSRFGLSEDTWTRGVTELRRHGLLETRKKPVSEDFGWRRVRNAYALNRAGLDHEPTV
jgi:hypothetical protein